MTALATRRMSFFAEFSPSAMTGLWIAVVSGVGGLAVAIVALFRDVFGHRAKDRTEQRTTQEQEFSRMMLRIGQLEEGSDRKTKRIEELAGEVGILRGQVGTLENEVNRLYDIEEQFQALSPAYQKLQSELTELKTEHASLRVAYQVVVEQLRAMGGEANYPQGHPPMMDEHSGEHHGEQASQ